MGTPQFNTTDLVALIAAAGLFIGVTLTLIVLWFLN